ncbi:WxcM-like protein [Thermoflavifilum aggregans]|uniref:WxcM-like protein n=1 Tax=Thermoflavifilum aggregans TaxID=454188 RepID=A0A2M9CUP2_9BACT|nr:FdtA/QdtA family cupin domain-containing protein [Thermoflavifilum aggregans]MBX6381157.1 FdtA/QdtA family cupin domain-containing protein [Thermoflavifilum aggregans]PJJ75620.1 WxcM-like protein [Thermoflavifilum aggregans]
MAYLIQLTTHSDKRGNLTVIEDEIPFEIKRIFYIYGVDDSMRGGHRHKTTVQAAICIHGSCIVSNDDGEKQEDFLLDHPSKCLILETKDWHVMHHFTPDAVLLVLASTKFDPADYIYEPYPHRV